MIMPRRVHVGMGVEMGEEPVVFARKHLNSTRSKAALLIIICLPKV